MRKKTLRLNEAVKSHKEKTLGNTLSMNNS